MNDLVPPDELHWDDESKSFGILSKSETEELIEACFRTGLKKSRDILKVVREYETVRSGQLLFKQFMSGGVGIYGFDEAGSPIFEPVRKETQREIVFESHTDRATLSGSEAVEVDGRLVVCHESSPDFDVLEFYRTAVRFCSKWGVDLLAGENPEEAGAMSDNEPFLAELRRRNWSVAGLSADEGKTVIVIRYSGNWLRTDY